MDKYRNTSNNNNNNNINRNSSSSPPKNVKKSRTHEHYLMRGNNNSTNTNNNTNNNNNNNSFISNRNNSTLSINDLSNNNNVSIDNRRYDYENSNPYNKKGNTETNSDSLKRTASVESIGFIEMELREAYNDPALINELNLNMIIPNLTLAVLQAAISTTNGLTNLFHNAVNPLNNKNKNNTNKFFNNKCQCTVPDPADLPIINHGKGVMDINDPNGRDRSDDQPFYNEVDDLIHDLPDSSEMYKDLHINEEEFGFKDLKKLDQYISGLAKNLRVDDINDNFITTTNEILSRYSNTNLEDTKCKYK
ncbi:hypothetical protein PIROE2DRAFT_12161 [Piromyces sp. E2]|nr:hypothetical protein PIROE2DRAFT_12161 [Piromyces sp. E2]|eukprot:OUM61756.1 hypothetical protein PIROE2DRAFT_12161 [Piromyces sp. E2]